MSRFFIMMIGNKNFLDISEHFISDFDQDLWFSLYESDTPSYFICYNIVNPISLGRVLEINFEQLSVFLWFFQFDFVFQRSFLLVFQQIIDHLDNDLFENQDTRISLTIHIYLNRPPYDSILDLGIIETLEDFYIVFFLFLSMICLNFLLFKFILKRVNHIMLKELKSPSTQ